MTPPVDPQHERAAEARRVLRRALNAEVLDRHSTISGSTRADHLEVCDECADALVAALAPRGGNPTEQVARWLHDDADRHGYWVGDWTDGPEKKREWYRGRAAELLGTIGPVSPSLGEPSEEATLFESIDGEIERLEIDAALEPDPIKKTTLQCRRNVLKQDRDDIAARLRAVDRASPSPEPKPTAALYRRRARREWWQAWKRRWLCSWLGHRYGMEEGVGYICELCLRCGETFDGETW